MARIDKKDQHSTSIGDTDRPQFPPNLARTGHAILSDRVCDLHDFVMEVSARLSRIEETVHVNGALWNDNLRRVEQERLEQMTAIYERVFKFEDDEPHQHGGEYGEGWRACIDYLRAGHFE